MKLSILGVLALSACVLCSATAGARPAPPQDAEMPEALMRQRWRVVRIAVSAGGRFAFRGTGFALVRRGRVFVITAQHTVENARAELGDDVEFWVAFHSPVNAHHARVIKTDRVQDVAVLATKVESKKSYPEAVSEGQVGTAVYLLGFDGERYAKDEDVGASKGTIDQKGLYAPDKQMLITSGTYPEPAAAAYVVAGPNCLPGASGSPVFDGEGRLIGLLSAVAHDGRCLVYAIGKALELLDEASSSR